MIGNKANPNTIVADRQIACIHYAAGMENVQMAEEIMRIMLDADGMIFCCAKFFDCLFYSITGDPNVAAGDGLTPLHVACIWGRNKIVRMLMVSSFLLLFTYLM